jgi:hypothetical protein
LASQALENGREMGLILEADLQRDVDEWRARSCHYLLGSGDAPAQQILVRPASGGGFELGGEVHAAQTGGGGDISEGDGFAEMRLDIVDRASQTPFR